MTTLFGYFGIRYILLLSETSKPPVNKTHFSILLINCSTVRNNIRHSEFGHKYPSIDHNKVSFNVCSLIRNDSVLYRICTWRTMLNVFRRVYTRIFIDKYPTILFHHKNANMGRMSIKKRGRAPGLIKNTATLRLISK